MVTIKVTGADLADRRYTPNGDALLEMNGEVYKFIFNDKNIRECDYWFVGDSYGLDEFHDNYAICPKENIFFIMGEAEGVKFYNKKFVRQFLNVITVQDYDYGIKNVYRRYIPAWFVGLDFPLKKQDNVVCYNMGYAEFKQMLIPNKTKLISVISSNKNDNEGHRKRLAFCEKLKEHFGDKIDFFGRGIRDFSDKWDVLASYKYHIAIENFSHDDYITEKLMDPFLTFSYPIYYGAPNVAKYFSEGSFTQIDINNVDNAIGIIEKVIENNCFEKNIDKLQQARDLVLDKYNPLYQMVSIIYESGLPKNGKRILNYIKSETDFSWGTKVAKIFGENSYVYRGLRRIYHLVR